MQEGKTRKPLVSPLQMSIVVSHLTGQKYLFLLRFCDIITDGIYSISPSLRYTFSDISTDLKSESILQSMVFYNIWLHVQADTSAFLFVPVLSYYSCCSCVAM